MRLTQGCFSFLPDLTDQQIEKQIAYAIGRGLAMNVEWTDDPHPRNNYWELWGLPLFDIKDPALVMFELKDHPQTGHNDDKDQGCLNESCWNAHHHKQSASRT